MIVDEQRPAPAEGRIEICRGRHESGLSWKSGIIKEKTRVHSYTLTDLSTDRDADRRRGRQQATKKHCLYDRMLPPG